MCLHIVGEEVCCESVRGARVRKPHRAGSKSRNFWNPGPKRRDSRKRAGDPPEYRKLAQKSGRDTGADTRNSARSARDMAFSTVYWWPPNSKYMWRTKCPKIDRLCSVYQNWRRFAQGNWYSPYKKWWWRNFAFLCRATRSRTHKKHVS